MTDFRRRDLLTGTALLFVGSRVAKGEVIAGHLPWHPGATSAPQPIHAGPWLFFSEAEAQVVGAIANRLIPPDPQTLGGQDAGCAVFIDRQLAGPYGRREGLYVAAPFQKGSPQQGPQSSQTPREFYRAALAALERFCRFASADQPQGTGFAESAAERQDDILHGLESGTVQLQDVDGRTFFEQVLQDVQQGFFADPIYGGNHDMCSWKMIGFPGAHYDYTDWVGRHNERYPHPPVSIAGRDDWNPQKG